MTDRIIRLSKPTDGPNIMSLGVELPADVEAAFVPHFSFADAMSAELEHGNVYEALQSFALAAHNNELCEVYFQDDKAQALGEVLVLHIVTPIAKAGTVIEMLAAYIGGNSRRESAVPTHLDAVAKGLDIETLGWFELDAPAFVFKDHLAHARVMNLFGIDRKNLPQIDRALNYVPRIAEQRGHSEATLHRLADMFDLTVSCEFNNNILSAKPGKSDIIVKALSVS